MQNFNVPTLMEKFGLSKREAEVAELVADGLPNKECGIRLYVTEKTIKFHLTNIFKKMDIKSRAQLIVISKNFQIAEAAARIPVPTPTKTPYDLPVGT